MVAATLDNTACHSASVLCLSRLRMCSSACFYFVACMRVCLHMCGIDAVAAARLPRPEPCRCTRCKRFVDLGESLSLLLFMTHSKNYDL